jgi:hypothetical protein
MPVVSGRSGTVDGHLSFWEQSMVREIERPPGQPKPSGEPNTLGEYPRHPGEPNIGYAEATGEYASNPPTPATALDVVFALGESWQVSGMEQRIKAQFEQHVRRDALQGVQESMELTNNPELARKMLSSYNAERAAGAYNWDGSACRAARMELDGLRHLFYLLLRRCHPDITEETATAVFDEAPKRAVEAIGWAQGNPRTPETPLPPGRNSKNGRARTMD